VFAIHSPLGAGTTCLSAGEATSAPAGEATPASEFKKRDAATPALAPTEVSRNLRRVTSMRKPPVVAKFNDPKQNFMLPKSCGSGILALSITARIPVPH
jgi:hypothetical protein